MFPSEEHNCKMLNFMFYHNTECSDRSCHIKNQVQEQCDDKKV